MFTKVLSLLALVALVRTNDLILGPESGTKIYSEDLQASPAIWKQIKNVTVNTTDDEVISRIAVADLREEKDGQVKIVEGGVGQKNVTIELQSPTALRGYDFRVEVYATKEGQDVKANQPGIVHPATTGEQDKTRDPINGQNPPDAEENLPINPDSKVFPPSHLPLPSSYKPIESEDNIRTTRSETTDNKDKNKAIPTTLLKGHENKQTQSDSSTATENTKTLAHVNVPKDTQANAGSSPSIQSPSVGNSKTSEDREATKLVPAEVQPRSQKESTQL